VGFRTQLFSASAQNAGRADPTQHFVTFFRDPAGVVPPKFKGTTMADNKNPKGIQDRTRINLSEDYEVRYAPTFGIHVSRATVD
jgi:hypothetical protein